MITPSPALALRPRAGTPRAPGFARAYGRVTVSGYEYGRVIPLAGAAVWAYQPGSVTPWPSPLFTDEAGTTPATFPVHTDDSGALELWAEEPGRVELRCQASGYLVQTVVLDLEPVPDAAPGLPEDLARLGATQTFTGINTYTDEVRSEGGLVLSSTTYLANPMNLVGDQAILPDADNRGRLGSATNRFRQVWTRQADVADALTVGGPISGAWNAPGVTRTLTVGVAPPGAPAPDDLWVTDGAGGGGAVASVNGYTGVVVLGAADVGALTQSAGDGRYLQPAAAAAAYLPLAGGSVLTGTIGPTTTNAVDTGTTALRWRKVWAVAAEFTNPPSYGGTAQPKVTVASSAPGSPATGDLWVW